MSRRRLADGFFLQPDHEEWCHAKNDEDGLTFLVYDGSDWMRRRNGDRGGSTQFHKFICNDISCDAVLYVRWDVLGKWLTEASGHEWERVNA